MGTLIAFVLVCGLMYLLCCNCMFNNHKYEVLERDDVCLAHKIKRASCGDTDTVDPYAGIGG